MKGEQTVEGRDAELKMKIALANATNALRNCPCERHKRFVKLAFPHIKVLHGAGESSPLSDDSRVQPRTGPSILAVVDSLPVVSPGHTFSPRSPKRLGTGIVLPLGGSRYPHRHPLLLLVVINQAAAYAIYKSGHVSPESNKCIGKPPVSR